MKNHTAFTARTAGPNSKETDKLAKVPHVVGVRLNNGHTVNVKLESTDPMTAINEVNSMTNQEFDDLLTKTLFHEIENQFPQTLNKLKD